MKIKSLNFNLKDKPLSNEKIIEAKNAIQNMSEPQILRTKSNDNKDVFESHIMERFNELNQLNLPHGHKKVFHTFLKSFNDLVQVYKDEEYILTQKGIEFLTARDYKNALECFAEILKTNPDNAEARSMFEGCKALSVLEIQKLLIKADNSEIPSLFDKLLYQFQPNNTKMETQDRIENAEFDLSNRDDKIKSEKEKEKIIEVNDKIMHPTEYGSDTTSLGKYNLQAINIFLKSNAVLINLIEKLRNELYNKDNNFNEKQDYFADEIDIGPSMTVSQLKKIGFMDKTINMIVDSKRNAYNLRLRIFKSSNKLQDMIHDIINCQSNFSATGKELLQVGNKNLNWMVSERQEIIKILRSGMVKKNLHTKTFEYVRTYMKVLKSIIIYFETSKEMANAHLNSNQQSVSNTFNEFYYYQVFDLYSKLQYKREN